MFFCFSITTLHSNVHINPSQMSGNGSYYAHLMRPVDFCTVYNVSKL